MLDRRAISRERVIGISFVDILIQGIFVLFVLLVVGYIDPEDLDKIKEYQQVGLDMCVKMKKDSARECREYTEGKKIGVHIPAPVPVPGATPDYGGVGEEACGLVGKKNPEECKETIRTKLGSLRPCLRNDDNVVRTQASSIWDIRSPTEIRFVRFTPAYEAYLQRKSDRGRLKLVSQVKINDGSLYSPAELEETFGFIREADCFHEPAVTWSCQCSWREISAARLAISRLKGLAQ